MKKKILILMIFFYFFGFSVMAFAQMRKDLDVYTGQVLSKDDKNYEITILHDVSQEELTFKVNKGYHFVVVGNRVFIRA